MHKTFEDEKLKNALPIHSVEYIRNNSDIEMKIDHYLFLEAILLQIRGETIIFATALKKQTNIERDLIKDIENLETEDPANESNLTTLSNKKTKLVKIRSIKMKGQMIRSRLQ